MVIRAVGVPPEKLKNVIAEAEKQSGKELVYNLSEKWGDQRIEILYDSNSPKMMVDGVMRIVVDGLNEYIYAVEDTPLATCIFEMLKLRNMRLALAESFTGKNPLPVKAGEKTPRSERSAARPDVPARDAGVKQPVHRQSLRKDRGASRRLPI